MNQWKPTRHNLEGELAEAKEKIHKIAKEHGLDFPEIIYQMVTSDELHELAAYGGFPVRYSHWRFYQQYNELMKGYSYGLQKISEMIINTDPCYAYLMNSNSMTAQKMVIAHCTAHAHFFKNNYCFENTNRKMLDKMANNASTIDNYMNKYGEDRVESFIDICLSLENLVDINSLFIDRETKKQKKTKVYKLKVDKYYMDKHINPVEFIEWQKENIQKKLSKRKKYPEIPERDVLKFLIETAPLEDWERDIVGIIRDEAYYFLPQGATKIMNEGFAVFWHSHLCTNHALDGSEIIEYANLHSSVATQYPGSLNPYALGYALLKDIRERWDKGRHGKEYHKCEDPVKKANWDTKEDKGLEKVFEVVKHYNDINFIDEFLTPEFCERSEFFHFAKDKQDTFRITSRQFRMIKNTLLNQMTNFGQPRIFVEDANYKNRGELLLKHDYESGLELNIEKAEDTIKNVCKIWKRPVSIITRFLELEDEDVIMRCDEDGEKVEIITLELDSETKSE